jgi:hypothetical protein
VRFFYHPTSSVNPSGEWWSSCNEEAAEEWRNGTMRSFIEYMHVFRVTKLKEAGWAGHVVRMWDMRSVHIIMIGKL